MGAAIAGGYAAAPFANQGPTRTARSTKNPRRRRRACAPASKLRPTDSGGARPSGPSSASRCPGSCHRRHRQQRRITCTLVIVHVFGAVRSGNRGHVPLRGRPGRCVTGGDSRRRRHASTGGVIRNARALTADDEAAETNRAERRPPQPHKSDSLFLNARSLFFFFFFRRCLQDGTEKHWATENKKPERSPNVRAGVQPDIRSRTRGMYSHTRVIFRLRSAPAARFSYSPWRDISGKSRMV